MLDNQWPDPARPEPYRLVEDAGQEAALRAEIEGFFAARYGVSAVLLPSCRAAIHALLEYSGLGRGDAVFAPRWSSTCVWDTIGRIANPTLSFAPPPDAVLAVHKWGYVHGLAKPFRGNVIEDSVDSLITAAGALFPTGGAFEVLSLPKLLAAHAGGIVLTQQAAFADFVGAQRAERRALGVHQSRLKHARALGTLGEFESPELLEPLNRHIDIAGLEGIRARLGNLERNASVIAPRLDAVRRRLGKDAVAVSPDRLPCLLPAPKSRYGASDAGTYMERRFNVARKLDAETFEVCRLLPLHFGIDEATFGRLLGGLHAL